MNFQSSQNITACEQELEEKKFGLYLGCSILIMLTMVLLIFMIYFTYKIWSITWDRDKIFPLMLIMLCISLMGVNAFWAFTII